MKFDDQNILWQLYLEGAAENMIISSLKKLGATPEHTQLLLQRDNGKMLFKPQDVPVLYDWIRNSSADTQELANDYKTYQKYFSNVPLNKFASYIDWTEKVHAKRDQASYQSRNKEVKDVDVKEQDQADVLADDEDVLILKGDSEHKCVRYGKGYSFCISRPGGGNMYGNYRMLKASTFYFIYFKKISKEDEHHIMVLDITDKGWEWTFGNNVTRKIQGGWNKVVKTFPVLAKYKSLFVNKPLTEEEKSYQKKLKEFVDNPNKDKFEEFSYQEKADILKFGMLIQIDVFESLDKYLRNEWVSVGPKMSDDIYKLLSPKEIERFTDVRKQQLSIRKPQDQFDVAIAFEDKTLYAEYILPEKELLEKEMQKYGNVRETENEIIFEAKYFPIKLPHVQKSGNIFAEKATSIDLPQLQQSANIYVYNATIINLPQLQQSARIYASNAKKITIPSHLREKLNNVPAECEIIHPDKTQSLNDSVVHDLMKSYLLQS